MRSSRDSVWGGESLNAELPLVAFDAPADADLRRIEQVLENSEPSSWWHFEVGHGTQLWWSSRIGG
jgi:hypothetical protein